MDTTDTAETPFRFEHGDFDITVFSDGYIRVPIEVIAADGTDAQRAEVMAATGDPDGENVRSKANIPLLRRGKDLILVDIGSGDKYQPSDGKLVGHMAMAGVAPSEITKIVITHGHPDHMWAMLDGGTGKLTFPNATYYVNEAEWRYWTDPDLPANLPEDFAEFARGAQRDFAAITDRVVLVQPGAEIITGVSVLDTAGHTPAHISLEIEGGDGLIVTGDVAVNQVASFRYPTVRFAFDTDSDLAIHNRLKLLDRAATDRTKLLGYHWSYPGIGFAERNRDAYRYAAA